MEFLLSRHSALAGNFSEGVSSSCLIDAVCQAYQWSQKWVLMNLQAEQSLVDNFDEHTQRSLDWAMGYGDEADYDNQGKLTNPNIITADKGFNNQIIHAVPTYAAIFRKWSQFQTLSADGQTTACPSAYAFITLTYTPTFARLKTNFDIWKKYWPGDLPA
jgi:hypothetical protein